MLDHSLNTVKTAKSRIYLNYLNADSIVEFALIVLGYPRTLFICCGLIVDSNLQSCRIWQLFPGIHVCWQLIRLK